MKKILYAVLLCLLPACGNSGPRPPERLPDSEVPAYRDACMKIADYVVLKDSAFHLDIDKESAIRMGVPEKYYERMMQELEYTNYLIREEYNKKGVPVELSEFETDTISNR